MFTICAHKALKIKIQNCQAPTEWTNNALFALFATHCLHLLQHTQFFKGLFAVTLLYILFYLSTLLFVIAFQKMPKQAASGKTKVNAFIREFHNEFISTPTDELFCKLCEKVVKHDKRFHVDQNRNGSVHQAKLTIPTTSRQSFIWTPNIPNFNETVVKTFLGANFPLKKLRHPTIRRLFTDMGHPLPSESTSRRIVENIAKEEENQIIYNFTNKDIFIVIDEAEVDGKKYLNILGGHVENPADTVALESILQSAPNQTTIVQHIDDCIRKLLIERKNLITKNYQMKGAEKIRNKYKNTDLLISSLKAATVKNPSRRNLFHEIGTPPQPVITRWGT